MMKVKLSKTPLISGIFLNRQNRFIAEVLINGKKQRAHVPNTGRMRELLISGACVKLVFNPGPKRKTDYTLMLVKKEGQWVCIHSGMANELAFTYLNERKEITGIKSEVQYQNSRFDFFCYLNSQAAYFEVKSVTLVVDGVARFPDAPTERGRKHLLELMKAYKEGFKAGVLFVVQRSDAKSFSPNWEIDPEFSHLLGQCHSLGLEIRALSCDIDGINIKIMDELPITGLET